MTNALIFLDTGENLVPKSPSQGAQTGEEARRDAPQGQDRRGAIYERRSAAAAAAASRRPHAAHQSAALGRAPDPTGHAAAHSNGHESGPGLGLNAVGTSRADLYYKEISSRTRANTNKRHCHPQITEIERAFQ